MPPVLKPLAHKTKMEKKRKNLLISQILLPELKSMKRKRKLSMSKRLASRIFKLKLTKTDSKSSKLPVSRTERSLSRTLQVTWMMNRPKWTCL